MFLICVKSPVCIIYLEETWILHNVEQFLCETFFFLEAPITYKASFFPFAEV